MAEKRRVNPIALGRSALEVTGKAIKHEAGRTYERAVRASRMASAASERAMRYADVARMSKSPAVQKKATGAAKRIAGIAKEYSGEVVRLNNRQKALGSANRLLGKAVRVTESPLLAAGAIMLNPKVANAGEDEWVKQRDIQVKQRQVKQIRARRGK